MRGGSWRAFVVLALLASAAAVCGGQEMLFVDGEPAPPSLLVITEDNGLVVPLEAFGLQVGVEIASTTEGKGILLRWSDGRQAFPAAQFPLLDGQPHVGLDWLVTLVGGTVHRIADAIYVETSVPSLIEFEADESRVVLRFGGFVPEVILADGEGTIHLRFHHCRLAVPPRSVLLATGALAQVDLTPRTANTCDLVARLREPGSLEVKRFEVPGFYSVSIRIGDTPERESVTRVRTGVTLHEVETKLSGSLARINYLYVEQWRSRYRLRPTPCIGDIGGVATLEQMARGSGADVVIGAGSSLNLLVVDGVPLSVVSGDGDALGIDMFGRLAFLKANVALSVRVEGVSIPIDDVNRAMAYGEVVAYCPGYNGEIARGIPGSFIVIKLRENRVVSVYEGAFVFSDPTAVIIVASGEAKARLSLVALGDRACLECTQMPEGETVFDAVGVQSILIRDGRNLQVAGDAHVEDPAAWSVVATDGYGGLILLSVPRGGGSSGATLEDVRRFLRELPVPVKDAVALEGEGASSLLYRDARVCHELGDGDRVAVALCLVPIEI